MATIQCPRLTINGVVTNEYNGQTIRQIHYNGNDYVIASTPTTITFYVIDATAGTMTYTVDAGMTWGQFVTSEYNVGNKFFVDGGVICYDSTDYIVFTDTTYTEAAESVMTIVAQNYYTHYEGPIYIVSTTVSNGTSTGTTAIPVDGTGSYTVTLLPNTNYGLPATVTLNGTTGTSGSTGCTWSYSPSTGVITISNCTTDLTISGSCVREYTITANITNGTATVPSKIREDSINTGLLIEANTGYVVPSDATITNCTYEKMAGYDLGYRLSYPTGDVTITAVCTAQASGYSVSGTNYVYNESGLCFYSLDNGTTWVDFSTLPYNFTISDVTQIKFKTAQVGMRLGEISSTQLAFFINYDSTSQNYTLTQNITDIDARGMND